MTWTLAIDTTGAECALALEGAGQSFLETVSLQRGHAEHIMPMLERLFAAAPIAVKEIGRIAVTTGPGAFTGIRVGLSVARGLAAAHSVPVLGVTTLMATALSAKDRLRAGEPVAVVLAGRGGQVFLQLFNAVKGRDLPCAAGPAVNVDARVAADQIEALGAYALGTAHEVVAAEHSVDIGLLARKASHWRPVDFPPEPYYSRDADAAPGAPALKRVP